MSSYAEMARRRKQAHTLYLKLHYLGLEIHAEPNAGSPTGCRAMVEGLKSLNPDHADRLMRLVRDKETALVELLPKRRPRIRLVRQDGPAP